MELSGSATEYTTAERNGGELTESAVLLGCGDLGPIYEPIERYSELVRGKLA